MNRKWLICAAGAVALYLAAGFFLVPVVVKWQLLKQLPISTHRLASVREVKFNPLDLSLTLHDLALTETNGRPFASLGELYVNFQLSSLVRLAWTFDEIRLKEPRAEIVLDAGGQFNFSNLFAPQTKAAPKPNPPPALPRLLVFNLSVTNGHLNFADLSRKTPFRTSYRPINFSLRRFATQPSSRSPYAFEARSDSQGRIAWAGSLSAQPFASSGALQILGIKLPKYSPYLEGFTRARLAGGKLDVTGNYRFTLDTNGLDLAISDLGLSAAKLEVQDPDTGEVVVSIPSADLEKGTLDWRTRRLGFASFAIHDPVLLVRRRADNSINLLSLISRSVPDGAPSSNSPAADNLSAQAAWVFTLDDCHLAGGSVQLEDATVPGPFRSLLKPVILRARHFSTATNSEAALEANITTEAAETVNLTANCSISPPQGTGSIELGGLELPKYQPYLTRLLQGKIASGKADISTDFSQTSREGEGLATLTNATLRLSDLRIQSPDGLETVVTLPGLSVENMFGSLAEKTLHVATVKSSGATLLVRREPDGTINLSSLIVPSTNSMSGGAGTPDLASRDWKAAIDEFALRDWTLHLTDRQTPTPGKLDLDHLALTLRNIQFPSNAPVAAEFSARVNGAGTVATRGTAWLFSQALDTEVQVTNLDIPAFQPWIQPRVKLGIERGALHGQGHLAFTPNSDGPNLHFAGGFEVVNFATLDQVMFKEFVRWDELAVKGITFDLPPAKAAIEQVKFNGLKTSVIIGPDKRPNFLTLLPAAATNPPPTAPTVQSNGAAANPLSVELGELRLEKTALHFGDQSVQPPCAFDLEQLDGTIRGLSTRSDSSADVDISGKVDAASPFTVRGKVNPLSQELTLELAYSGQNVQLTPFTPYMEKYGGHSINKGRLSLDLNYAVHARQLKASNTVRIDQLMLGPRNQSPDATKLPVKLAVALLKDSSGRIQLDVPVEGRLDDPQFKLGPIILKVIVNLIAKAAVSPFKLLGALVGSGEELSFVDFDPGTAQFLNAETNKLEKLVQALEKRPSLNLEIEGSIDPVADRDALARSLVRERMKSERLLELSGIGQTPASAETFQLDPVDYERLLRAAVVKQFGTNLTDAFHAVSERAAAALTNSPAVIRPPNRGPGLLTRVASLFKPRHERAATTQAHRTAKADALLLKQNPELGKLTAEDMETVLAAKTEVPAEHFGDLRVSRCKSVQAYLLSSGKLTAERLFLVAPKESGPSSGGAARVNLSLD